jgi:beta-galactosidase
MCYKKHNVIIYFDLENDYDRGNETSRGGKGMEKSIKLNSLQMGVCYYPEQWPEEMWEDDFRRMREINISVVRLAEFAWAIFEPEEGIFSFELFGRVLELAHKHGLQVILGTPTATPPAWLTFKYPEVLNVNRDGVVYQHGMRRHYNYSSPKYRELCARITHNMVEAYRTHPSVIGWQIDNELNCETNVFYAEADHLAFRKWLMSKYGTLEQLNKAWGTVFWSQTYTAWEQIYLTRLTVADSPNPHLALDEKRFISDNTISFASLQVDIIRELSPQHWITTNGTFGHLNNHEMTDQLLDFISYDSYPQFSTIFPTEDDKPLKDRLTSYSLSNVRSISPNFCVMEQQSGPGGWVNRMEMGSPRPGQVRLWSYQSILHGTDLLVYFRWRTATVGTEIYWHGINDYHNQPNRRVREISQIGSEFTSIGSSIAGTRYQADVAIMQDYDNLWDGEFDKWHGPLNWQSVRSWFKQLQYRHIPVNILNLGSHISLEELQQYKVIVYPHPAIMTDETAQLLTHYVEEGGKLFLGARTGYKNPNGHCYMRPLPGPVADLCGITVEDFTIIRGTILAAEIRWKDDSNTALMKAECFNDILKIENPDVEVIAEYTTEYYAGEPALTRRKTGQGEVWYYGAAYSEVVVDEIIDIIGLQSPVSDWLDIPEEVEMGIRSSGDTDYVFLLNYSDQPVSIVLKKEVLELLSGESLNNTVLMPPYGVLILK